MIINSNSLLLELYSESSSESWKLMNLKQVSICDYISGILRGMFVVLFIVVIGSAAGALALSFPVTLILFWWTGFLSPFINPGLFIVSVFAYFALTGYLTWQVIRHFFKKPNFKETELGQLISTRYKAHKDKYCPIIPISEKE